MAQQKAFAPDTIAILKNGAVAQSAKYYHNFSGTPHVFLSLFSFLNKRREKDERYQSIFTILQSILNEYEITGPKFEETMLMYYPKGEASESSLSISTDADYKGLVDILMREARAQYREMQVEDLILYLFENTFSLFTIFSDKKLCGSVNKTEEMYNKIKQAFKRVVTPEVKELEKMPELTNLNKWVKENPQTIINGDEVIMKIEMGLAGRTVRNVMLTGPAGCGKSTYVYGFVQQITKGEVPDQFKDKVIYELDPTSLIAGTRFRGDFEEKIANILNILKENKNVILFVDEIHRLVNLGSGSDGGQSAGNMLKPYLTRNDIQLIGCTTNEEYTKHIRPDMAFASRFHEIKIRESDKETTREILKGLLPVETEFFNKQIQEEILDKVLNLSYQYTIDQANPRKAIKMLELACAYSKVAEEKKEEVSVDDIINAIRLEFNIFISEDKLKDTEKELFKQLLGQEQPLKQVLRNLSIVDRGIVDLDRPLISMLLAGSTGVGKTETCKIIAKTFFGSEENLVKINCGEYSDATAVTKLSGSSAGYVGYDDEPLIIKSIREKPSSVVLFDEIEKAHRDVQKILLNILDTGEMVDNKGNKVSFKNTIIIFTTNLGCTKDTGKATGMGLIQTKETNSTTEIMKAIEDYFSPEFLGRLDDIVFYNSLTKEIANDLISRYFDEYKEKADIEIEFTPEDIEEIIKESEIESRGARGLRRAVRKQIVKAETRELKKQNNLVVSE